MLTDVTVGCPKVSAGNVSLNPLDAAAVTAGALALIVMAVVFTVTLPAVMLLMITCAHPCLDLKEHGQLQQTVVESVPHVPQAVQIRNAHPWHCHRYAEHPIFLCINICKYPQMLQLHKAFPDLKFGRPG